MIEKEKYIDNFRKRRDYYKANFSLKIGKQRTDVKSEDILLNSCPVCGYLTLDERDSFEICTICFWEDDGVDDFEENELSGPNHMTLKDARTNFQETKRKLLTTKHVENNFAEELKYEFIKLDYLIEQQESDKMKVIEQQTKITDLLLKNTVYGLKNLIAE